MDLNSSPRWELGVATFFIVACLLILWETRTIPPGTFEPLGSAPVPQATAVLIIVLSLTVGLKALRRLRGRPASPSETATDLGDRPLNAVAVAALTVLYVALLDARAFDFAPLTALFLFLTIGFLIRLQPRGLVVAAAVAAIVGWGAQYVFTRVFVVDLPGL